MPLKSGMLRPSIPLKLAVTVVCLVAQFQAYAAFSVFSE
jgi:hypothetical protein